MDTSRYAANVPRRELSLQADTTQDAYLQIQSVDGFYHGELVRRVHLSLHVVVCTVLLADTPLQDSVRRKMTEELNSIAAD